MAAGGSSRMGSPKQLLPWNNSTLIETAIKTALASSSGKIFVVLGANSNQISQHITSYDVETLYNMHWVKGLGHSIAAGVKHIMSHDSFNGVLVMLADQPLISSDDLDKLIASFKEGKRQIVATQYENTRIGVPAIFDQFYYQQLATLNEDKGAKEVLLANKEHILAIELSNKLLDIDTKEAYNKLLKITRQL